MIKVNSNEFLEFIYNNKISCWKTLSENVPFFYDIDQSKITFYISTGNERTFPLTRLDDVCEIFNTTNSFKTTPYNEFRTKSYLVSLLKAVVDFQINKSSPTYFSILNKHHKSLSRSKIYEQLGVKLRNEQWAWGGVSHDNSFVVFTIWVDAITSNNKLELYNPNWVTKGHGLKEQKRLLEIVRKNNLPVFGLLSEATDTSKNKRNIRTVEQNDLLSIELEFDGETIRAILQDRFPMTLLTKKTDFKNLAVDDLDQDDFGNESPNRTKSVVAYYQRDPKVRRKVIKMAEGKCEYCSQDGFLKLDGSRYLEAHHIIALSNDGKDKVSNVIALCPGHHKEAHFGKNSEALESEFIDIVNSRNY
ncbi:HNH endonuclease [Marinicella sp. S1101]|uniref:HNH endonuclease n=1 Tax=Marinicella marina TaxID=2996016 RepID=UPI0022608154|nr:HNH endonuclease [Marinicella marina]MCX7554843.1 HNH endonuclease [Marinicella marina]MDJ1141501.1 HNH endonuclease [Marinicella marina]